MKQFMKKHDVWLRLLSIVLAFFLWVIVRDVANPDRNTTIRDVAVTITGEEELQSNYNLSVI